MNAENVYTIGGVKVQFPVKPYPSQMAMMAHIVKGIQRRQNCLLESPTGSGKSLALLCSTLAWQQAEADKADRYNSLISQGITDPDILARAAGLANTSADLTQLGLTQPSQPTETPKPPAATQTPPPTEEDAAKAAAYGGGFIPEDDDDDFKMPNNRFRMPRTEPDSVLYPDVDRLNETRDELGMGGAEPWAAPTRQPARMKVPKIFFGTRTHKQIYQIVKELRRTSYKHVRSVVLSSREHTCIHPTVSKSRNKNEGCRELLDPNHGQGCRFNQGVAKIKRHEQLANFGLDTAWDIEDLVRLGKKIKACPYYAARSLMDTAEIIFCPYNYLIDPLIREAMSINLAEQIIVLDEAHNIEDSAREAASTTLTQEAILEARNDLEKLATMKVHEEECKTLAEMLSALSGWVDKYSDKLTDYTEFDRSGKIFTGTEMIAHLDLLGIKEGRLSDLKHCLTVLTDDQDPEDVNPRINSNTSMLLKSLFLMYNFLFMENMKYRDDYRIALVKSQTRKRAANAGGWYGRRTTISWEYSINFWCLNPGVAFNDVGASVRCIILTSGTLSPMSSFQSELEVPFKIQLEANHVIDKNQVWVGTIGKGPTDQMLQATYRHTETWGFQDELGKLVLDVCQAVPRGVLCFLPSYAMLNKLLDRWQSTGMWDKLNGIKIAMTEPRSGEEFEETMKAFYDTIRETREGCANGVTGAFFMAVCRGKVSEGLDFTDDNARAVIAVGIPFPSIKDIQVDLKRQYNNTHCRTRGLLSGGDWYEIQAYRAINQALGRCIRHRYDWGALILVDERYQRGSLSTGVQQNKYTKGLSKWVRNKIVHQPSYAMALSSLRQFADNMTANPPQRPESINESETVTKENHPNDDSVCDSSSMTKADDTAHGSEISESKLISPLSMLINGLGSMQNTTHIHTADSKSESAEPKFTNETDKFLSSQFSSTIVGGHNERDLDEDFCCTPGDLVLPPSRMPFTSTQMSQSTKSNFHINSNSQKDSGIVKEDTSAATSQANSLKETLSSKLSQMLHSETTDNPAKKRRSFVLTSHEGEHGQKSIEPKVQNPKTTDSEVYEFQYVDLESKKCVSPLKELIENEIKEKPSSSSTQNKVGEDQALQKRNHKHELEVNHAKNEDEMSSHPKSTSPQMFDSDEDLFANSSPKKIDHLKNGDESDVSLVKKSTNVRIAPALNVASASEVKIGKKQQKVSTEKQQKAENRLNKQSKGCGKVNCGKENSQCCKAARKRTLSSQNTSFQGLPVSTGDDSDLDDFNLNQSYSSPGGERIIKKASRVRLSLSRSKGVQFDDDDL